MRRHASAATHRTHTHTHTHKTHTHARTHTHTHTHTQHTTHNTRPRDARQHADAIDKIWDINVKAALLLVQAAAPHMRRGGRVVFISSVTAYA
jgi:NAD(P)-dependent dehydrogenase (short-subunit alcohol dehydrogenase family)